MLSWTFLLTVTAIELLIVLQPSTQVSTKSKTISSGKNLKLSRGTIAKFLYNDISQSSSSIIEYHPVANNFLKSSSTDKTTISHDASLSSSPIFVESEIDDTFKYIPSTSPTEYRVVQFYDSNRFKCPDCGYFKEHYVKLAGRINEILQSSQSTDIKVSFYAISCPHYPNLCMQQKATSNVPIIRLYRAGSQDDIDGIEINYHSVHPFQLIDRLGIRDKLKETKFLDAHAEFEADWRVGSEIEQKRHHFHNTAQGQHHSDKIITNKKEIDKVFPKIASELEHDVNKVIDNMLRNYIHVLNIPKPTDDPNEDSSLSHSKQPYLPVPETNQHHLQNMLVLLRKTLPQAWQPLHRLLQDVLDNMSYVSNDHEYLIRLLDEHIQEKSFVVKKDWSQYCTMINEQLPQEEDDDDHSCGFWQLLQAISVGVVEWNQIAYDATERLQPSTIMTILTNFFHAFNGGGFDMISSSTLQYMYSTCAHDGCNRLQSHHHGTDTASETDDGSKWIEFPLWMNEMRNYFNIQTVHRIAYNKKRRPSYQEEINVQRPTIQECPRCWQRQNHDEITDTSKKSFILQLNDNEMIYRYLKVQYGPQDYPSVLQTLKRQLFAKHALNQQGKRRAATSNASTGSHHYDHHFHGSNRQSVPILQVHSASAIILVLVGLLFRLLTSSDSRKTIRQLSSRHLFVDKIA
jgi:hypothetical protein